MATRKSAKGGDQVFNSLIEIQKASQRLQLPKKPATRKGVAAARARVDVCATYKKIRPFLELIINFPLIPKKIKDAIRMLMQVLDSFCPV